MASPLPFPDDYLDFLRQWTGTLATEQMLVAPLQDALDDDFVGYVQKLYGVGDPGRGRDIRECQADYAFNERVPSHYVSIGQDGGWNRVAMSLEEKTRGHILMWRPGEGWEPDGRNVPTTKHLHPVAGSFSEFWDLLTLAPPYDE